MEKGNIIRITHSYTLLGKPYHLELTKDMLYDDVYNTVYFIDLITNYLPIGELNDCISEDTVSDILLNHVKGFKKTNKAGVDYIFDLYLIGEARPKSDASFENYKGNELAVCICDFLLQEKPCKATTSVLNNLKDYFLNGTDVLDTWVSLFEKKCSIKDFKEAMILEKKFKKKGNRKGISKGFFEVMEEIEIEEVVRVIKANVGDPYKKNKVEIL